LKTQKLNRVTKRDCKFALKELQDEKKTYFSAYNYWWKRVMDFVECPVISLTEYLKRESEYDFGVRITKCYAIKYIEIVKQERSILELLEKK